MQEATDLAIAERDAKVPGDEQRHAGTGPDVASKPMGVRSLREQRDQRVPLCDGELGRPARRFAVLESLDAGGGPFKPATDRALRHAEGLGNRRLGPTQLA